MKHREKQGENGGKGKKSNPCFSLCFKKISRKSQKGIAFSPKVCLSIIYNTYIIYTYKLRLAGIFQNLSSSCLPEGSFLLIPRPSQPKPVKREGLSLSAKPLRRLLFFCCTFRCAISPRTPGKYKISDNRTHLPPREWDDRQPASGTPPV